MPVCVSGFTASGVTTCTTGHLRAAVCVAMDGYCNVTPQQPEGLRSVSLPLSASNQRINDKIKFTCNEFGYSGTVEMECVAPGNWNFGASQCRRDTCSRPVAGSSSYDFTGAIETLKISVFSVTGVTCASGYNGRAVAVACLSPGPYGLAGCVQGDAAVAATPTVVAAVEVATTAQAPLAKTTIVAAMQNKGIDVLDIRLQQTVTRPLTGLAGTAADYRDDPSCDSCQVKRLHLRMAAANTAGVDVSAIDLIGFETQTNRRRLVADAKSTEHPAWTRSTPYRRQLAVDTSIEITSDVDLSSRSAMSTPAAFTAALQTNIKAISPSDIAPIVGVDQAGVQNQLISAQEIDAVTASEPQYETTFTMLVAPPPPPSLAIPGASQTTMDTAQLTARVGSVAFLRDALQSVGVPSASLQQLTQSSLPVVREGTVVLRCSLGLTLQPDGTCTQVIAPDSGDVPPNADESPVDEGSADSSGSGLLVALVILSCSSLLACAVVFTFVQRRRVAQLKKEATLGGYGANDYGVTVGEQIQIEDDDDSAKPTVTDPLASTTSAAKQHHAVPSLPSGATAHRTRQNYAATAPGVTQRPSFPSMQWREQIKHIRATSGRPAAAPQGVCVVPARPRVLVAAAQAAGQALSELDVADRRKAIERVVDNGIANTREDSNSLIEDEDAFAAFLASIDKAVLG
jgi:hypothetical protein